MIGTAAAVLVGTWIWPVHARVQYFRVAASMLTHLTEYCEQGIFRCQVVADPFYYILDLRMSR